MQQHAHHRNPLQMEAPSHMCIIAPRRFDFGHICSQIGEHLCCVWSCEDSRKVENVDSVQDSAHDTPRHPKELNPTLWLCGHERGGIQPPSVVVGHACVRKASLCRPLHPAITALIRIFILLQLNPTKTVRQISMEMCHLEWGKLRPNDVQMLERGWWKIFQLYPSWLLPFAAFLPMLVLIRLVLGATKRKATSSLPSSRFIHRSSSPLAVFIQIDRCFAVAGMIILASLYLLKVRGGKLIQWLILAVASIHLLVLIKGLSATVGWILVVLLLAWVALDRLVPQFRCVFTELQ